MKEKINKITLVQLALIAGIVFMGIVEAAGSLWLGIALCCSLLANKRMEKK